MRGDELKERTKEFAHRCVKLAMALPNTQFANHIRGQLFRCSTSVASNYRATCIAQSKASFISKLRVRAKINSQILRVEAPGWQGAKVQEYQDILSFRNAARPDASALKM